MKITARYSSVDRLAKLRARGRAAADDPVSIGDEIAERGALISVERDAVASAAAQAIRDERRGAVWLTPGEAKAALEAIGQMTDGNARDFGEWKKQTCGNFAQWKALLRAEAKIAALIGKNE